MNKMLKTFAVMLFLVVAKAAFAQVVMPGCLQAPQIMNQPPRCYDGRIIPPGAILVPNQVVAQPGMIVARQPMVISQPMVIGQQVIPQGVPSGFSNCTVIGGVLGAITGNQIDNHHAGGTIAGGLLGGAIANLICSNGAGQRVTVQQPYTLMQPTAVGVDPTTPGVSNVTVVNTQRPQYKLEQSSFASQDNTCRLRVNGNVVATTIAPPGTGNVKAFCDNWQLGEARNRGLIR